MSPAVILAAGAGRRMGGAAKALLTTDSGKSFLQTILDTAREAGCESAVVVVGQPFADDVSAEAVRLGAEVVVNPEPERGMASSVALGFAAARASFPGESALLWPVDHPNVRAATVRDVLSRTARDGVAIPCVAGRGGHPAGVGEDVWLELELCEGQAEGARSVFRRDPSRVVRFEVDDEGVVADIDTRADLA
jgi:CTP:molybdopterin cytidylyltransferase MocA